MTHRLPKIKQNIYLALYTTKQRMSSALNTAHNFLNKNKSGIITNIATAAIFAMAGYYFSQKQQANLLLDAKRLCLSQQVSSLSAANKMCLSLLDTRLAASSRKFEQLLVQIGSESTLTLMRTVSKLYFGFCIYGPRLSGQIPEFCNALSNITTVMSQGAGQIDFLRSQTNLLPN